MVIAIVGSGPAGLILARILQGWVPIYDTTRHGPHPDTDLHGMLQEHPNLLAAANDENILSHIRANYQSFFTANALPVSLLLDTLSIPDEGSLESLETSQNRIKWSRAGELQQEFVLLDESGPGGQWATFDFDSENSKVLSYAEMLSLPGWAFTDFFRTQYGRDPGSFYRPTRKEVADYYRQYQIEMGIEIKKCRVTEILRQETSFIIHTNLDQTFQVDTVILASGICSSPTPLTSNVKLSNEGATVVVGSGVSAADAVLSAPGEVVHIYKWLSPKGDPTPLRKYPKKLYPEYEQVFQQMRSRKAANYRGLPNARVGEIRGNQVDIHTDDGKTLQLTANSLLYRMGRRGSLDYARQLVPVEGSVGKLTIRTSVQDFPNVAPGVYIAGSLTGDSLVRFILGICCQICGQLLLAAP